MEILVHWDFAFVHQVLSFSRVDDGSITASIVHFARYALDRYFIAQRYASIFVEPKEAAFLSTKLQANVLPGSRQSGDSISWARLLALSPARFERAG
jgi:hypothetical protein